MILDDIVQVVYEPKKIFKKIVENPKYLGVILVLLLFVALQFGYEYTQFSKIQVEYTTPRIPELAQFTNATLWTSSIGTTLSNNYSDYFNYTVYAGSPIGYYNLFTNYTNTKGPSSLEISAANASTVSATLQDLFNVNCAANGYNNLSITMKLVSPQMVPVGATLTLYSLNKANYYTYQLTSDLSSASTVGTWQNFTVPLGPASQGWINSGAPNWSNITALKLDFNYPSNSNITIRIGALFFRGQYESPLSYEGASVLTSFIASFVLQFAFTWVLLSLLIYLFFKGFKAAITWKPLFVTTGFALFIMVVRAAISFIAVFTLPTLYFPYDMSIGSTTTILGVISYQPSEVHLLMPQSQAAANAVLSATGGISVLSLLLFVIAYVWVGYLCTIIIGQLNSEFSLSKKISIAGVSVAVTVFLLLLFSLPI